MDGLTRSFQAATLLVAIAAATGAWLNYLRPNLAPNALVTNAETKARAEKLLSDSHRLVERSVAQSTDTPEFVKWQRDIEAWGQEVETLVRKSFGDREVTRLLSLERSPSPVQLSPVGAELLALDQMRKSLTGLIDRMVVR